MHGPSQLRKLAKGNPKLVYGLLFEAASQASSSPVVTLSPQRLGATHGSPASCTRVAAPSSPLHRHRRRVVTRTRPSSVDIALVHRASGVPLVRLHRRLGATDVFPSSQPRSATGSGRLGLVIRDLARLGKRLFIIGVLRLLTRAAQGGAPPSSRIRAPESEPHPRDEQYPAKGGSSLRRGTVDSESRLVSFSSSR